MKILVTGAQGFIGNWVARTLAPRHDLTALGRQQLDVTDSIKVQRFFRANEFDCVIHCAVSGRNRLLSHDPIIVVENILAYTNLVNSMGQHTRLINIGSGAEFGLERSVCSAHEDDIWTAPVHHSYAMSKNMIARMISKDSRCYNLRVFGCFGPGEGTQRLIPRLVQKLSSNQSFVLDQDRTMDMVSVQDVATVVSHVVEQGAPWRDINVVYQEKTRLSDLLRVYCSLHNIEPNLLVADTCTGFEYTGNGSRLASLQLDLRGLSQGLELYDIAAQNIH